MMVLCLYKGYQFKNKDGSCSCTLCAVLLESSVEPSIDLFLIFDRDENEAVRDSSTVHSIDCSV